MRILVGWDDSEQAELIRLYLNVDEDGLAISTDHEQFLKLAQSHHGWDVVLMTTTSPDHDTAFETFLKLRELLPDCPIVGACPQDEVYRVARYLTAGMRSYVIRDEAEDFMFLLHAILEGAVIQARAEQDRLLAEKLRREIESVRKLQETIIPHNIDCPEGYEIVARYESSQIRVMGGRPVTMAGGDYYDVFRIADDSVVMLVGDASGHGMKACMSIMTMHTLMRMIRDDDFRDTSRFVEYVNRQLCQQAVVNDEGGFITLLYGILNPQTHELQWTSAGHPLPLLQHLGTGSIEPLADLDAGGLPLGIYDDADYSVQTSSIPPNSRLVLYTDGLAEAFPPPAPGDEHREFGQEGLTSTLCEAADLPLPVTLQRLFDASNAFTGGQGRHDDTSVVLAQRNAVG
jgi:serine phosphatase RsbU (regulator of sigma subunit)